MVDSVEKLVVVIDPDTETRAQTVRKIHELGLPTRPYSGGDSFLSDLESLSRPTYFCVVSELRLPDTSGLALQQLLRTSRHTASFVFYISVGRIRDVVRAMREGAIGVVEKSEGSAALLDFVEEGVELSRLDFLREQRCAETMERLRQLNLGEQQVLQGIMAGKLNKEIAQELSLSIRTIEQRRRDVFRKLDAQHPALLRARYWSWLKRAAGSVSRRKSCVGCGISTRRENSRPTFACVAARAAAGNVLLQGFSGSRSSRPQA